jgi:hypothetical protein
MIKRRKKKHTRRSDFATAQQVAERIIAEGPEYLDKNLVRMMLTSANLRDEREFADLTFDPQRTLEAAARHFPRFRRRILRTAERNEGDAGMVYDDYRIAAMEELDTPRLREYLSKPWHLSRYIFPWALVSWFQVTQETLAEVVTPKRQAEIAAELRAAGQQALESDDAKMRHLAPHFLAVAESVASADYPPNNGVLRSMFLVSFDAWFGDTETLSPQWQRFLDRADKSRFLRSAREDGEV